ncbi:MAG TPA: hypothetical protein PLA94_32610 [Myxococcota bacterium]|nr:hypothetical protein [Myxococcota bacterium]
MATNRKDRSYPVVTSAGDTTRIALQDLHRDAKELNFFVYSRPLKAMVYQYRHGSLGPHGFVDLLKSRYNKAKQAAGKEDWERKKEYQGALRYSVVTRKASLDELIANMEQGEIVAVEANDGRAPPSITQKKTVWHFSNKKVPDYSLGGWVRYIRQQFLKVSVQGTDRAGQRQTINVEDEIQTRLALLEMEHEDWMGMMEGAQFRSESFPKDAGTTHLLLPIRKLMEVLIDHAATLRPPG